LLAASLPGARAVGALACATTGSTGGATGGTGGASSGTPPVSCPKVYNPPFISNAIDPTGTGTMCALYVSTSSANNPNVNPYVAACEPCCQDSLRTAAIAQGVPVSQATSAANIQACQAKCVGCSNFVENPRTLSRISGWWCMDNCPVVPGIAEGCVNVNNLELTYNVNTIFETKSYPICKAPTANLKCVTVTVPNPPPPPVTAYPRPRPGGGPGSGTGIVVGGGGGGGPPPSTVCCRLFPYPGTCVSGTTCDGGLTATRFGCTLGAACN
jgi:hypothetical protein